MINITQGQANTVIFTGTEKVTISAPVYFLFEFINPQTNKSYYCTGTDTSLYSYRYNEFIITEKTSPNPLNGEISLAILDCYQYNIYQQNSATNLNPALAQGIVETGKCIVAPGSTTPNTVYNLQPKTNIVYGN